MGAVGYIFHQVVCLLHGFRVVGHVPCLIIGVCLPEQRVQIGCIAVWTVLIMTDEIVGQRMKDGWVAHSLTYNLAGADVETVVCFVGDRWRTLVEVVHHAVCQYFVLIVYLMVLGASPLKEAYPVLAVVDEEDAVVVLVVDVAVECYLLEYRSDVSYVEA